MNFWNSDRDVWDLIRQVGKVGGKPEEIRCHKNKEKGFFKEEFSKHQKWDYIFNVY